MTISPELSMPPWHGFLTPVLEVLSDGEVWKKRELHEAVLDHLGLTPDQRAEVLPSGQHRADNRVGWALSGLNRAELVAKPARATFTITEAGRATHVAHPEGLDEKTLAIWEIVQPRARRALISTSSSRVNMEKRASSE